MSNVCDECGHTIAACNEIALLKRAMREIRREADGTRYLHGPIEACGAIVVLVDDALGNRTKDEHRMRKIKMPHLNATAGDYEVTILPDAKECEPHTVMIMFDDLQIFIDAKQWPAVRDTIDRLLNEAIAPKQG